MLASTIQFSNNNPTNTTHHPTQEQPIMRQANHETPTQTHKKVPRAGNFRTQQRAHPTPTPDKQTFHTPQE